MPETPPGPLPSTPEPARSGHAERLGAARRALILEAAQRVFSREGLAQASLRAIAREAGCTTGAIYPWFGSKEALYAALLEASLDTLHGHLAQALARAPDAGAARAVAWAFYDYYGERPAELSLGFYLFQGLAPRGLGADLDRGLNTRLADCVALLGDGLARTRPGADAALGRIQMFTYLSGLLLLRHTGRLKSLASLPSPGSSAPAAPPGSVAPASAPLAATVTAAPTAPAPTASAAAASGPAASASAASAPAASAPAASAPAASTPTATPFAQTPEALLDDYCRTLETHL